MTVRDPSEQIIRSLAPSHQPYAVAVINALRQAGLPAVAVSGRRTLAQQMSLYAQGRTKSGPVVTNTLNSYHLHGRAFDVAFMSPKGITWDVPAAWWTAVGQAGESLGWRWGGRWRNPDRPHLEA